MNILTPVIVGNAIFTSSYQNKSWLYQIAKSENKFTVSETWSNKNPSYMSSPVVIDGVSPVNVQPFIDGDVLYGFDQNGELMAIELPSGKRLWKSSAPVGPKPEGRGTAFLVKQNDRFSMFNERGELVIGKLSPTGYEEINRVKLIEPTNAAFGRAVVWCAPAFANKRMYVRNDKECICGDLAK